MFFIWTNDGGPLQYIGLVLFFFQVGLPLMENVLLTSSSPYSSSSSTLLPSLRAGMIVGFVGLLVWHLWTHYAATNNATANLNVPTTQQRLAQWREGLRLRLSEVTGIAWSHAGVSAFAGAVAGSFASLFLIPGSVQFMMRWVLPYLYQCATLASILATLLTRQRPGGMFNNNNNAHHRMQQRQAKLDRMTELVCRMPLEEFVSQEAIHTLSVAKIKQMLMHRGTTVEELDKFVDRQNLQELLQQRRQYSEECCICFESYQEGDPMRVLPKCRHELHVDCLDKWVYTFANDASKLQARLEPTCPLCKEPLLQA